MTLDENRDDGLVRMSPATLARFDGGLSWFAILDMSGTSDRWAGSKTAAAQRKWWTAAISDAEERGLIRWTPKRDSEPGRWHLTAMGRELVRAAAVLSGAA